MSRAYLERDPFGRQTLVRDYIRAFDLLPQESCGFCGGCSNHGGLFKYGWEPDGGSGVNWMPGMFCSKPCMEAYHA